MLGALFHIQINSPFSLLDQGKPIIRHSGCLYVDLTDLAIDWLSFKAKSRYS